MPSYHMHIEVRGAITWPKSRFKGMFRDTLTGRSLNADEARSALMDHLAAGRERIPCGRCDNFDYGPDGGCLGHEETA